MRLVSLEEATESSLSFCHVRTWQEDVCKPRRELLPKPENVGTLISIFQLQNREKINLCCSSLKKEKKEYLNWTLKDGKNHSKCFINVHLTLGDQHLMFHRLWGNEEASDESLPKAVYGLLSTLFCVHLCKPGMVRTSNMTHQVKG